MQSGMRAAAILLVLALSLACPTQDTGAGEDASLEPSDIDRAAARIDEESLRSVIAELSRDSYGGRAPGTEGDRAARAYAAERLAAAGFEPGAADGGWEQRFKLVGMTAEMPETWEFRAGSAAERFRWWDEYMAASGAQRNSAAIADADVVFAGYGIFAPEERWDDFKDVDVRGKVLLVLNNDPDWDAGLFGGKRRLYYGRWTYKYEIAAERGAAAAIIIHTDESAGYPWQVVQTSWSGEQFELPAGSEPRLDLAGWLTEDAARRLVALAGEDLEDLVERARSREFRPVPLGVRTSIEFKTKLERTETANVLGLLRGRDGRASRELVVYTAHHDHLGTGRVDASGDAIYNGALDNASGVAQVLAIAEAFAALPVRPRRSILVNLVGAEEQGLLGSLHFSRHPTAAPGRLAANINIDGGNIWGRTEDVAVIGRGKTTLERLLEGAAARQDRVVTDEPFPDKGYYYRSDQLNFARIGVPALYFKSGTRFRGRPPGWGAEQTEKWIRENYHQPSDELEESWNFEGMLEDARLAFEVGVLAADAPGMPEWLPGDEFEAARREALAALESP